MASGFDVLNGSLDAPRRAVSPFTEAGVSGTAISFGYIQSTERNPKLRGYNRYSTAMDIILNSAVVGAGTKFFLNMVAKPKWAFKPADDSPEAEAVAEFVKRCTAEMTDSWPRTVRRMAAFKVYGFGVHEWTAERAEEGYIRYASLESRPWHTIERWDVDIRGTVLGMEQRAPLNGLPFYIPRGKTAYLVDDSLTDSPEGIGLWRMLVEPFERFKSYSQIEANGFERDLRGIPVASVPYGELAADVEDGVLTQAQMDAKVKPYKDFVSLNAKGRDTGFIKDSSTYTAEGETSDTVSSVKKYDVELLTASGTGFADIGNAIDRCQYQMAMLCGTENLLVGSGDQGSKALSEDKTRNFSMNVDSTLMDIVSAVNKDFIPPLMILNGIPRRLWPVAETESAAYMDAAVKAQIMASLGNAGAVTRISDPAVSQIRVEAGLQAVTKEMISLDEMDAMNDQTDPKKPSQIQKIMKEY